MLNSEADVEMYLIVQDLLSEYCFDQQVNSAAITFATASELNRSLHKYLLEISQKRLPKMPKLILPDDLLQQIEAAGGVGHTPVQTQDKGTPFTHLQSYDNDAPFSS